MRLAPPNLTSSLSHKETRRQNLDCVHPYCECEMSEDDGYMNITF